MKKSEEKQFFLEFIDLYRSLPALWNIFSKDYADKKIKHKQYGVLKQKYNQWYPSAKMEDMKKKINTLRTNYRREMKRLADLNKSGNGEDSNDSSLYYYKALQFLRDCETPRPSISTMDYSNKSSSSECEAPIKRRKLHVVEDDIIALAKRELSKPTDDFDRLGETWASKMRKMESTQQLWAEKFINEILLEGQLGNLYRHSVQIVESLVSD